MAPRPPGSRSARSRRAIVAGITVAALLGGCSGGGSSAGRAPATTAVPGDGTLEPTACPAGAPIATSCGYVPVPLAQVADAAVFVVRIAAPSGSDGDPLLYVGGDAGAAVAHDLAGWRSVARQVKRDVVLVDRRGTGLSRPVVECPGVARPDYLARSYLNSESREFYRTNIAACRKLADEAGIIGGALNTAASADDLELVRTALGVERWFVGGQHHGARLAIEVARRYPSSVAGLVLDAPWPAGGSGPVTRAAAAAEATSTVLGLCPTLPACGGATDVQAQWTALVDGLVAAPATVQLVDAQYRRPIPVRIYQRSVWPGLADALRRNDALSEVLPSILGAFRVGDWDAMATWRLAALPDPTWNVAAALDVVCSEESARLDEVAWTEFLRANAQWDDLIFFSGDPTGCDAWAAPPANAATLAPLVSDVPTLVMRGQLDPTVTGPMVDEVVAGLADKHVVTITLGAGDVGRSACGWSVVAEFLADPVGDPSVACTAAPPAWAETAPA